MTDFFDSAVNLSIEKGCIPTLKKLFIILLTALCAALLGCAPGVIKQTSSPALPPVNPGAQITSARKNVRLYFRVADEPFISTELRRIDVKADAAIEAAAMQALIDGPGDAVSALEPLIPQDTAVVSVKTEGGILFLKLSADFARPAALMPEGWIENTALREAVVLEKKLALAAIANTLTELGADRVSISIDANGDASALENAPAEVLTLLSNPEPLPYSGEYVLTPGSALSAALMSAAQGDWERVARLCVSGASEPLSAAKAARELGACGALTDYSVESDSTAADGSTATVIASVSLRGGDGLVRTRESIPVRALRAQEVFRIDYESLLRLLGGSDD